MTLSAYEKQVLREIDDDLSAQDPLLASRFSAFRGFRLRLWQVGTCFVVGLCLYAAGLTRAGGGGEALALCGYLVIVGSAGWLFGMVVDRLRRRGCGKS